MAASCIHIPDLALKAGETVWLRGASGLGKSTLIKALAGIWPHGEGTIELPAGNVLFLPQQVYAPLGGLADAAVYPADPGTLHPIMIDDLLDQVGLAHRRDRAEDGTAGLSVGEQQRLAFIRILAAKPDWVFLDEATSALDLDSEGALMELLHRLLPRHHLRADRASRAARPQVVAHRVPERARLAGRVSRTRLPRLRRATN